MLKSLRLKTFKDLRASRGQFFAVWLVVMLGVAFYAAMYPAGVMLFASVQATEDELSAIGFHVVFDATTDSRVEDVLTIPGVQSAESRLTVDAGYQPAGDSPHRITLRLISVPDDRLATVNTNDIVDGDAIRADNEILLLKSFADHHGLQPGDVLPVWLNGEMRELTVAGTAFNPEYMIAGRDMMMPFPTPSTFGVAYMRYTPLAEFAVMDGLHNNVVVHLEGSASDENIAVESAIHAELDALYADVPGAQVVTSEQTPSGSVLTALINGNFPIMEFFSGVFLLGSVVMTSILLGRLVQGERRRIGTMRAMGITRRELVMHYLSFGLLIGVTGGIVGVIFGYLNSLWVMAVFIDLIIGGTLPAFSYAPQVDFLLLGFVVAVTGSMIAGIVPAWVESGTPPGVALRPAAPAAPSRISRMQLPFLPMTVRRAIRNMLRTPGRSISTVLGVGLGAMMIFSAYAMWDSNETGFTDYFGSSAYDLRVDYQPLVPRPADRVQQQVSAIDGVAAVQTALIGPVTLRYGDASLDTVGVTAPPDSALIDLTVMQGVPAFSRDDGLWIGHNVARILDMSAGDRVTVEALGQSQDVLVHGIVSYVVGSPVYVPESMMAEFVPGGMALANTAFVRIEDGQADAVRDALITQSGVVGVEVMTESDADFNTYLLFFRVGTLIFGSFGYVLTLAVLFNTVNAGMSERIGELSILRALGSSGREIAAIVLLELLLLTIIGALIGTPIGREVGFDLLAAYDTEAYSGLSLLTAVSLLLGWVSLIVIVVFATLPGLRAVQQIDLGAVSKSQSI